MMFVLGDVRMDASLFRRVAKRCRELMERTDIEAVKEQLCIWAEEFDEQAKQAELAEAEA